MVGILKAVGVKFVPNNEIFTTYSFNDFGF